jgi:hypothetical protein
VPDVGDAIEITFNAPTGATVTMSWYDPDGTVVLSNTEVAENPGGSGKYPVVLLGSSAGQWRATFHASGMVTAVETYYETFIDPTGPPPLATISEYTELFGALSITRQSTAKALLRRASQLVRDRFPIIDAQIAAGTTPANSVAMAVLNMVSRVMRNPSGLRSETTGPFSRAYDNAASSGYLALTAEDLALIDPSADPNAAIKSKGRVGTIRVRAGLAPWPEGWRR